MSGIPCVEEESPSNRGLAQPSEHVGGHQRYGEAGLSKGTLCSSPRAQLGPVKKLPFLPSAPPVAQNRMKSAAGT